MTAKKVVVSNLNAYQDYVVARLKVRFAEERRDIAFRGAFLEGASIGWMHGAHLQTGEVIRYGYSDSLIARNHKTGRGVYVRGYQIIEAVNKCLRK